MSDTILTPPQGTPPPEAPGAAPVPAAPPADDRFLDIKWNGKEEWLARDRARELAQKGYDYTQKLQALARERDEFDASRSTHEQGLQEIRTFLSDAARIEAYLTELKRRSGATSGQPAASAPGDDDVLTARQVQELLAKERQQLAGLTQQQIAQLQARMQVDQLSASYTSDLDAHIGSLVSQHPELKAIPRLGTQLKQEVATMRPRSIEDAKNLMHEVARNWAAEVRNFVTDSRKPAPDGKTALSQGIEPRGGAGPMPPAQPNYKSVTDPNFKQQVMQDIINGMKG